MLTKNDLVAIKNIVSEEVRREIAVETNPIKRNIDEMRTNINDLQKDMKPIKKDLRKIKKDINTIISFFDDDIVDTKRRVDRIENHLHLSPIHIN